MQETLEIRIATPDDVHTVMELALSACDENGFVNPNPQKLLAEIWPALNRIGAMWYSDDQVLEEKDIFIHPEFRSAKGGRARQLCEFSKQVADSLGIPLIIGVLSNHRTEAKVKLYERQFGKPSGAFFLYGAKTGYKSVTEH